MREEAVVNPEAPGVAEQLPAAEAAEAVHGHEVAAGTSEVAAHGGEGGGLPQFDFQYWGGQIIWLLIFFAILYVLLSRVFIPRLRKALQDREDTIAGALAAARQVQAEADADAAAARAQLAEARASAGRTAADAKARAAAETARRQAAQDEALAAKASEAETRIRGLRDQAMANVRAIAGDTAEAMVDKLTGRPVTTAEIETALDAVGAK
jgi:F-type H+-transporting ATPase subunit b